MIRYTDLSNQLGYSFDNILPPSFQGKFYIAIYYDHKAPQK